LRIAVLGAGLMGAALATRLLALGHDVAVYNRTAAKAAPLGALGATIAETPGAAIEGADAVFIVLVDAEAARQTLLGAETLPHLAGKRLLCVTTTSVEDVVALGAEAARHGATMAEVSVMVGPEDIVAGQGQFILGSSAEEAAFWEGLFATIGEWVHRAGELGFASQCDKAFIAPFVFNMMGVAYTAAVADRLKVPPAILSKMLTNNPVLGLFGAGLVLPLIEARQYETTIASVDAMRSALGMLVDSANELGISTAPLAPFVQAYDTAADLGFSGSDSISVFEVLNPKS